MIDLAPGESTRAEVARGTLAHDRKLRRTPGSNTPSMIRPSSLPGAKVSCS
jgi:hypothetical protein